VCLFAVSWAPEFSCTWSSCTEKKPASDPRFPNSSPNSPPNNLLIKPGRLSQKNFFKFKKYLTIFLLPKFCGNGRDHLFAHPAGISLQFEIINRHFLILGTRFPFGTLNRIYINTLIDRIISKTKKKASVLAVIVVKRLKKGWSGGTDLKDRKEMQELVLFVVGCVAPSEKKAPHGWLGWDCKSLPIPDSPGRKRTGFCGAVVWPWFDSICPGRQQIALWDQRGGHHPADPTRSVPRLDSQSGRQIVVQAKLSRREEAGMSPPSLFHQSKRNLQTSRD